MADEYLKVDGETELSNLKADDEVTEKLKTRADGCVRSVLVKYKNSTKNVFRTTNRAVRTLIVIHRVDEIDLMEEVGMSLPLDVDV